MSNFEARIFIRKLKFVKLFTNHENVLLCKLKDIVGNMPCWFDLVRYLRIYLRTVRSYVRVSTPFCRFARALDCGVGHTNTNSKFSDQCESQTDFSAILVGNFVIKVYV